MDLHGYCKPCLYGFYTFDSVKSKETDISSPESLLKIAAKEIVKDSWTTSQAISVTK